MQGRQRRRDLSARVFHPARPWAMGWPHAPLHPTTHPLARSRPTVVQHAQHHLGGRGGGDSVPSFDARASATQGFQGRMVLDCQRYTEYGATSGKFYFFPKYDLVAGLPPTPSPPSGSPMYGYAPAPSNTSCWELGRSFPHAEPRGSFCYCDCSWRLDCNRDGVQNPSSIQKRGCSPGSWLMDPWHILISQRDGRW